MPDTDRVTRAGKEKPPKGPEVSDAIMAAISQALNSREFIENITTLIMKAVSVKLDDFMEQQHGAVNKLVADNSKLKLENDKLAARLDNTEQYLLRNNIRLLGVPENDDVSLRNVLPNIFNKHLGLKLSSEDIESCYRVGRRSNNGKPRGILIKFHNYQQRQLIFQNKAKLKSTGLSIKEDLTPAKLKIFLYGCEKFHYRNVWTRDGLTYIKSNNKIVKIKSTDDIDNELLNI